MLAKVIERVGPVTLKPRRDRFAVLVHSIVSQQISLSAARSIYGRLVERLKPDRVTPRSDRSAVGRPIAGDGLSRPKAGYMLDLAGKCGDGTVRLGRLGRLSDEAVIEELVQIKGIGRWSAQMFLIFSLGRPDVFPLDDLGVRRRWPPVSARRIAHPAALPRDRQRWKPYSTIGSWYCWPGTELDRAAKKSG